MEDKIGDEVKKRGIYQFKPTNKAIYLYLMDQIYRPRYTTTLNGYSVLLQKKFYETNEDPFIPLIDYLSSEIVRKWDNSNIYLGTGIKIDGREITDRDVRSLYFRDNNIPGIVNFLKEKEEQYRVMTCNYNPIIIHDYHILWKNITTDDGKFKPPAEYHTIKKMLDKEQLFEKTESVSRLKNLKQYFPKEDKESFIKFLNSLKSAKALENFTEYSMLFSTRYMQICLNKQFVLDILNDNNIVIDYCIKDDVNNIQKDPEKGKIIERTHCFELKFFGRFKKRYETTSSLEKFIALFEDIKEHYSTNNTIELKKYLEYKGLGTQSELSCIKKIPEDKINDFIKNIEMTIRFMKEALVARTSYSDMSTITKFDTDPEGIYREEDPWSDIVDFDADKIGKIQTKTITKYKVKSNKKEISEIYAKFGKNAIYSDHKLSLTEENIDLDEIIDIQEKYPIIVNNIITPILSLIQFSPSALFYFVCEQDKWAIKTNDDACSDIYLSYYDLINSMTKMALKDYMNGMTIDRVFPIKCSIVGNVMIKNKYKPSVLTFTAENGCNIMFTWSEDLNNKRSEIVWPLVEGHKCYDEQLMSILDMCSSVRFNDFYDFMKTLLLNGF